MLARLKFQIRNFPVLRVLVNLPFGFLVFLPHEFTLVFTLPGKKMQSWCYHIIFYKRLGFVSK